MSFPHPSSGLRPVLSGLRTGYRAARAADNQDCQTVEKGKPAEKRRRKVMGLQPHREPGLPDCPKGKTVEKQ
jgi:hypothetical protein